jgi:predicted nucleic acid-binding protein
VLVDTSVWVDHFRWGSPALAARLRRSNVLCHPFVVGELACGNLRQRDQILALLTSLPEVSVATHDEALAFVDSHRLMGSGIGWVDAHLLASALLSNTKLWTLDKRLASVAREIGIATAG